MAFILAGLLVLSIVANAFVTLRLADAVVAPAGSDNFADQVNPRPIPDPVLGPVVEVSADDDPLLGSEAASVELIAFLDYECPFCTRFHADSFQRIVADYVAEGTVRFVARDFPLDIHPRAMSAAIAAACVRSLSDDATFYDYHDALFETGDLSDASLRNQASARGLDATSFDRCIADTDGTIAAEIAADMADGTAAGVTGTPTVFVNGRKIVGSQPYEVFKAAIDAALSG